MIKHLWTTVLPLAVVTLLAACASTPRQESAQPTPTPASAATPATPESRPATGSAVPVNPLNDPNNILSKRSIYYDFDKSDIKPEFRPLVQAHAKYLRDHPGAKITVQGNCDERGSSEYNIALGQRRADEVKRMLVLMDGSESQIETVSFGKEKPRCTEHDEACWAQNRRGDIIYERIE